MGHSRKTEVDVAFLSEITSYSSEEILSWHSAFSRDCPTGRLTRDVFVKMYSKLFLAGNSEDFCRHVFRIFDTDKNGYIDFKEFLLSMEVASGNSPERKLEWAFRLYDVNGDGNISRGELEEVLGSLLKMQYDDCSEAGSSTRQRPHVMFSLLDQNKDGEVTREEFVTACMADTELVQLLGCTKIDI